MINIYNVTSINEFLSESILSFHKHNKDFYFRFKHYDVNDLLLHAYKLYFKTKGYKVKDFNNFDTYNFIITQALSNYHTTLTSLLDNYFYSMGNLYDNNNDIVMSLMMIENNLIIGVENIEKRKTYY